MKHNTHAFSRTHMLNKESQQSGLLTNFQNIVNVANEDVNNDQTWSKMWLEEETSIGTSKARKISLQEETKSSLQ